MTITRGTGDPQNELNRMSPAARDAKLGDCINDLITGFNLLLAKMDADAGITDTDYASTLTLKTIVERAES